MAILQFPKNLCIWDSSRFPPIFPNSELISPFGLYKRSIKTPGIPDSNDANPHYAVPSVEHSILTQAYTTVHYTWKSDY